MAKHRRIHQGKSEEPEEDGRLKKKAHQPLYDQLKAQGEDVITTNDFPARSSVDEQAAALADIHSDEQRAGMIAQLQQSYGNAHVQRVMERIREQKGKGKPLTHEVRSEMEAAFNQDFSDVHIHSNPVADNLAKELGARAVTSGKDIFFSKGAYQPESEAGKTLLGHELTHVVQQERSAESGTGIIGKVGDAFEREADLMARELTEGHEVSVEMAAAAPSLQMTELRGGLETASTGTATAETEAEDSRLGALRAMWDSVVVENIHGAQEALQEEPPDFQAALDNFIAVDQLLVTIGPSYRSNEALYYRMGTMQGIVTRCIREIQPHLDQVTPVEEILDVFEHLEGHMSAIREGL